MKILKIRFRNIHSLKGDHEIDFTAAPLAGSGIFAITGQTGSGKTTILDVISLALYNRIPRVSAAITKKLIGETWLIVTRNTGEAMAEVTYACPAGVFTSKWSISSTRNNTLRDHQMELFDEAGLPQDIKKAEVPAKNAAQIGLNFDQFVKAILLAQGDFSAFLKARADERGALLEKVTGTEIYRRLGIVAFQKNKEQSEALERLMDEAKSRENTLLSPEDYEQVVDDIALYEKEMAKLSQQIADIKSQEELKNGITALSATIEILAQQFQEQMDLLEAFHGQNGEAMEKHRQLMPHKEDFWNWQQLGINLNDKIERLTAIEKELQECADENTLVEQEVRMLTQSDEEVDAALDAFRKKVLDLQGRRSQAAALKDNAGKEVLAEVREAGIILAEENPAAVEVTLRDALKQKQSETSALGDQLDEESREAPLDSASALEETLETVRKLVTQNDSLAEKKGEQEKRQGEIDILQQEVNELPEAIEKARLEQEIAQLALDGLEKERTIRNLSASLEEHRAKLVEGEACPLCGSREHPYSQGLPPVDDELDLKISKAKTENEGLKTSHGKLNASLTFKKDLLRAKQGEAQTTAEQVTELEEKIRMATASLPEGFRQTKPVELEEELKTRIELLKQFSRAQKTERKLQEIILRAGTWKSHSQTYDKLDAEVRKIFEGEDVVTETNALSLRFHSNRQRQQDLMNETLEVQQSKAGYQEELVQLNEGLLLALPSYASVEEAMGNLMKDRDYEKLKEQEDKLAGNIRDLTSELKVHRENLEEKKKRDVTDTAEELQAIREQKEGLLKEQQDQRDFLVGKRDFQLLTLEQLKDLREKIEERRHKNEKWVLLRKYIGDAEGKKFSTFAQELTLHQLAQLANQRLVMLSGRYQLDIPSPDEDDSLVVIDTHMGDMRRSVKSLSGGESFLVSLSLALALSDLAARKVKIGSLFIDEGFGSLDKLTLDQTIDTLEKLQYTSKKTIGVISHVEAMQERITTQIRLEKTGQGHSKLTVV